MEKINKNGAKMGAEIDPKSIKIRKKGMRKSMRKLNAEKSAAQPRCRIHSRYLFEQAGDKGVGKYKQILVE